ncbi:hypothetical protein AGMMS49982_03460 [Bacteroidia bacterium]|nr:hypothetical protein AGMMS49982_03460 [Bacteroidia bacterium]
MNETIAMPENIRQAYTKYNSYDPSCWTQAYFDYDSGGFNVYHTEHKFSQTEGGGDAEKVVGKMLAKHNGRQVEFLPEGKDKSPDYRFCRSNLGCQIYQSCQRRNHKKLHKKCSKSQ